MRLYVLGVLDQELRVDNGRERLGGEISTACSPKGARQPRNGVKHIRGLRSRLTALEGCEVRLDRVILVELGLDVFVHVDELLRVLSARLLAVAERYKCAGPSNLLQGVNELAQGLIGAVPDLVPGEAAEVLVRRFCIGWRTRVSPCS